MPIEDFDLSVREYYMLRRCGISTVGELTNLTIEDIFRFRSFSKSEVNEIRENLNKLWLDFAEEK